MKSLPRSQKGSVLVAVLWLIAMLGVFCLAVSRQASQELMFGQWLRDRVLGRSLAKAAIQRCLTEIRADQFQVFDAFQESWGSNEKAMKEISLGDGKFSVVCEQDGEVMFGACDEAGRINLNKASAAVLAKLVMAVDSSAGSEMSVKIADAIVDWRDPDDSRSSQGAEAPEYKSQKLPYEAANADLKSVEELSMIKGVTPELYRKLLPYVTIYTDGRVNFNTAPAMVLKALGLADNLAMRIVNFRKGADGKTGTTDDEVFQDATQIVAALGSQADLSGEEYSQMMELINQGLMTTRTNTFRIHAVGILNREARKTDTWITCVIERDGNILRWKEGLEA